MALGDAREGGDGPRTGPDDPLSPDARSALGRWNGLDVRAVVRGSLTYLGIAVPCALIISLSHGNDPRGRESNLWIAAAVVVVFVAPLAAGAIAGAAQRRTPLIHGGLAVALPISLFLVGEAVVRATQGSLTTVRIVTSLLYLGVFTSCGLLGGYVGFRHRLRST